MLRSCFLAFCFLGVFGEVAASLLLCFFFHSLLLSLFLLFDNLIFILEIIFELILDILKVSNTLLFNIILFALSHKPLFLGSRFDILLVFDHVFSFLDISHGFLHFPILKNFILDVTHHSVKFGFD